jgi:DNA-directed RNA polymerase II subunit RPB11
MTLFPLSSFPYSCSVALPLPTPLVAFYCLLLLLILTMNAPERSSAFILDDDEEKIEYAADTKVSNAGTFTLNKEDHTMSNLLRMQLLRDPQVKFAGYMHPHPLVHKIHLKIQTTTSQVAPAETLSAAIEDLSNETDHLITQVSEAVEKWKKENDTGMMGM